MPNPTIRDVAHRAQVSVASVSRVLNDLDNVSEDVRGRVAKAIGELGYVPHAGARSLSLARSNAIGVVLPDLHGEFFSEIVRGMDREASSRGYLLLLSNMHSGGGQAAVALGALRGRVDGLLVMAPHVAEDALNAALPADLPAVLVNTRAGAQPRPSVHVDNGAGARAIADHLLALGRRKIVHIAGPPDNYDAQQRASAFAAAIRAHADANLEIVQGDFGEESGRLAIHALLRSGAEFDSIFAGNDMMAIGALQALKEAGRIVPDEVAVVGFDDIPLSRHLGLSTMRVRIAELGERAVAKLIDRLGGHNDHVGDELHAPELVVRATSTIEGTAQ